MPPARARRGNVLLAAFVTLVGLSCSVIWTVMAVDYARFPGTGIPLIGAQASPSSFPSGFAAEARRHVGEDPLDQKKFNALYVFEAAKAPRKVPPDEYQRILARQGWRDSSAQVNLLYAAALREDYTAVFQRTDALLMRGVATAQVLDVLYLLETLPEFRSKIVARLAAKPQWRRYFFVNDHGYGTMDATVARTATVGELSRTAAPVEPDELAPMIASMVERGEVHPAYSLWKQVSGASTRGGLLLDSDFQIAAQQPWVDPTAEQGSSTRPSPFAWQFNRGMGFEASADGRGGAALLHLRWDGNGVPVLLSQRLRTKAGPLMLRIGGPDAQPRLLQQLRFTLSCGDQEIAFDRLTSRQDQALAITADAVPSCTFPVFKVAPNVERNDTAGFEITLSSIQILPR